MRPLAAVPLLTLLLAGCAASPAPASTATPDALTLSNCGTEVTFDADGCATSLAVQIPGLNPKGEACVVEALRRERWSCGAGGSSYRDHPIYPCSK